jgi:FMN phosphatase YigB (HAD superfamily)
MGQTTESDVAFLFDVDNTLIDNDRLFADFHVRLQRDLGQDGAKRYWTLFESLRKKTIYADYLGALQAYRAEIQTHDPQHYDALLLTDYLVNYPFAERLYPHVRETVTRLNGIGQTAILCDGDAVFQTRKIRRSGLWDLFSGNVMIYIHKEKMCDLVERLYPARHYVVIDDKIEILAPIKKAFNDRVTTVLVRQGSYAMEARADSKLLAPDVVLERIGDLIGVDLENLLRGHAALPESKK